MLTRDELSDKLEVLQLKNYVFSTCKLEMMAVGTKFDVDIWSTKIERAKTMFEIVGFCRQNNIAARFYLNGGTLYNRILCFSLNRSLKRANKLMHEYFLEAMACIKTPELICAEGEDMSEDIFLFAEKVIDETYLQIAR